MRPAPLAYHRAETVAEALAALGRDASVLAGGQSLLPELNLRRRTPRRLVDITRIAGLRGVRRVNGHVEIGAAVRQAEAEDDADLAAACPLLAAALPLVGYRPVRNLGTVCGSIAHADPAAELPAVAVALDAELALDGPRGPRTIAARDFFRGAGRTALDDGELLVALRLPVAAARAGAALRRLRVAHGGGTVALAAAAVALHDGRVEELRVACAGVDAVPVRATAAERSLRGAEPAAAAIADAARLAAAELEPVSDRLAGAGLRRQAAETLMRRAIAGAVADAERRTACA